MQSEELRGFWADEQLRTFKVLIALVPFFSSRDAQNQRCFWARVSAHIRDGSLTLRRSVFQERVQREGSASRNDTGQRHGDKGEVGLEAVALASREFPVDEEGIFPVNFGDCAQHYNDDRQGREPQSS